MSKNQIAKAIQGIVFDVDGDPTRAGQVAPLSVKLPKLQFEGVSFVPDGILMTAESREIVLYQPN